MKLGHPHHLNVDRTLVAHWHPDCILEHGQACLLHVRPGGNVEFDETAMWISELIDGQRTVQQIVDTLHSQFPNLPEIGTDVDNFIGHAHKLHWIELRQARPEQHQA